LLSNDTGKLLMQREGLYTVLFNDVGRLIMQREGQLYLAL
jgi:hypothetical protein